MQGACAEGVIGKTVLFTETSTCSSFRLHNLRLSFPVISIVGCLSWRCSFQQLQQTCKLLQKAMQNDPATCQRRPSCVSTGAVWLLTCASTFLLLQLIVNKLLFVTLQIFIAGTKMYHFVIKSKSLEIENTASLKHRFSVSEMGTDLDLEFLFFKWLCFMHHVWSLHLHHTWMFYETRPGFLFLS